MGSGSSAQVIQGMNQFDKSDCKFLSQGRTFSIYEFVQVCISNSQQLTKDN